MCGRIGFAWWNGAQLDSDAKQWRLFADVLNDAAIFLELVSQVSPDVSLLVDKWTAFWVSVCLCEQGTELAFIK